MVPLLGMLSVILVLIILSNIGKTCRIYESMIDDAPQKTTINEKREKKRIDKKKREKVLAQRKREQL